MGTWPESRIAFNRPIAKPGRRFIKDNRHFASTIHGGVPLSPYSETRRPNPHENRFSILDRLDDNQNISDLQSDLAPPPRAAHPRRRGKRGDRNRTKPAHYNAFNTILSNFSSVANSQATLPSADSGHVHQFSSQVPPQIPLPQPASSLPLAEITGHTASRSSEASGGIPLPTTFPSVPQPCRLAGSPSQSVQQAFDIKPRPDTSYYERKTSPFSTRQPPTSLMTDCELQQSKLPINPSVSKSPPNIASRATPPSQPMALPLMSSFHLPTPPLTPLTLPTPPFFGTKEDTDSDPCTESFTFDSLADSYWTSQSSSPSRTSRIPDPLADLSAFLALGHARDCWCGHLAAHANAQHEQNSEREDNTGDDGWTLLTHQPVTPRRASEEDDEGVLVPAATTAAIISDVEAHDGDEDEDEAWAEDCTEASGSSMTSSSWDEWASWGWSCEDEEEEEEELADRTARW